MQITCDSCAGFHKGVMRLVKIHRNGVDEDEADHPDPML